MLRILGAYQDGHIFLRHSSVRRYSFDTPAEHVGKSPHVGHGDFLVDEIRLLPDRSVEHEIRFSCGSRFLIQCSDIEFEFRSKARRANAPSP